MSYKIPYNLRLVPAVYTKLLILKIKINIPDVLRYVDLAECTECTCNNKILN